MISYQESVTKGTPMPCTPEIWDQLIDSPEVKSICDQIAALDTTTPDYNDRKQALKRRLPIIIPHAASFRNGKRVSADAIPSGLAMLDVDHVSNPRDWFESIDKQLLSDNRIYLVAITASGQGLRLIGERLETSSVGSNGIRQMETIEAAQLRIATALGIKEYDAVTKDLARASYVVPRSYILWIYEAGLFAEREVLSIDSGLYPEKALPPHQEVSSVASESDSDIEVLTYRGMPYDAIVKQLMIEIGAAEGASCCSASFLTLVSPKPNDAKPSVPLSVARVSRRNLWCSNRLSLSARKRHIWTSNRRWKNPQHCLCPNCRVCSNWSAAVCRKTTVLR